MNALLGSVLEMHGTEHGRSGDNDHVHTRVDNLLICVEVHEAVLLGNLLIVIPLQIVAQTVQTIGESIAQSDHLDAVGGVQQVDDGARTAAAATDNARFQLFAVVGLIVQHGNIIFACLLQRSVNRPLLFT